MKLLIDTNVILDMVLKRSGCDISMELFRKVRETGASAYITASSVTDIFYIIRKEIHDTDICYHGKYFSISGGSFRDRKGCSGGT